MKELQHLVEFTFSTNRRYWFLLDASVSVMAALVLLIEEWVFSPGVGVLCVYLLLFGDFLTSLAISMKTKEGFRTDKFKRFLISLVVYPFLLSMATIISKSMGPVAEELGDFGTGFVRIFPFMIFFPIVMMLMLSVIKNASILGWINQRIASWLYKNVDTYKNVGVDKIKEVTKK